MNFRILRIPVQEQLLEFLSTTHKALFGFQWALTFSNERVVHLVGVLNAEGPPVPIPNTEVKLCGADNTWWETAREDRSWPTLFLLSSVGRAPDC